MSYLNYEGLKRYDKKTKKYIKDKISEASLNGRTVDLSEYATKEELKNHTDDTNLHVTSAEKNTWNAKLDNSDLTNYATKTYVTDEIAKASLNGGTIDLTGYEKTIDVDNKLNGKVDKVVGKSLIDDTEIERLKDIKNYDDTNIKNNIDIINNALNNKANKTDLFSGDYDDLINKPIIPDTSNLTTKTELKNHTDDTSIHITSSERTKWNTVSNKADKSHTHTKSQITDMPTKLSQFTNDSGFITSADVDTSQNHTHSNKAVLDGITSDLITKWNNKAETSDIPDISNLASKTYVTDEIAKAVTGGTVDLTGYAKTVDVDNKLSSKADKTEIPDISNLATKNELSTHTDNSSIHITASEKTVWNNKLDASALGAYTTTDDLNSALALKANKDELFSGDYNDLQNLPVIPDTSNFATKGQLNTHTSDADIHITNTERTLWNNKLDNTDLTNYATKTYVTDEIAKAVTSGTVDLTGYAKTVDVNAKLDTKVDKVDGKSLVSDAEITRLSKISNYDDTSIKASITSINSELANKANKSDLFSKSYNDLTDKPTIPSLDGYATKTYVTDEINKASLSGTVDLSEYAKTADVNTSLNNKVDKTNILSAMSSNPSDDKLLSEKAVYNALLNNSSIYDDSETEKYFHNTSAHEFVNMLSPAVNLGNTLDCHLNTEHPTAPDTIIGWETLWNNVETTKKIMETYKKVGFKAIRIPITWHEHMDENGVINSEWFARVKVIVDWAIESGLIAIINAHHDTNEGNYINAVASDYETSKAHLINIWTQVGEYFADYDNRLVFESMNECLNPNLSDKWHGDTESFEVINKLNQVFVNTVRSQAWNRNRFLLVPTYGAGSSTEVTSAFVMPRDNVKDRLIVEVHTYNTTIGKIKSAQASVRMNLIERGFPVFLGEYGIRPSEVTDETERLNLLQLQTKMFREMGVGVCIWDNGNGSYKLLNRKTYKFYYPDIVNGIIKSSNKHDFVKLPYLDENYNIKDISNWKEGKIGHSDGEYDSSATHYFTSDQHLIPRYNSYIVSMNDHSNDRLLVVHRDKNMKMIGKVETKTNGGTITISDDDRYIDFCYYNKSTTSTLTKEQFAEYINNGYLQINKAEGATQNFEIIEQPLNEALIDLDKRIGNGSSVDLSDYAKIVDVNSALDTKAEKSTVEDISNSVTSIDTSLSGITERVSGLENDTATIINEINNLNIGGRNYIKNSIFANGLTHWEQNYSVSSIDKAFLFNNHATLKLSASGLTSDRWSGVMQHLNIDVAQGKTYTLSYYYYVQDLSTFDSALAIEVKAKREGLSDVGIGIAYVPKNSIIEGKWTKISVTLTINITDISNPFIYVWLQRNGTAWFTNFKLEEGTIATDWTPAPEDVDESLSNKVDKIDGKGLSTNDYTTDEKTKVSKIVTNGDGSTFLASDGTYKKVSSSASAVAERKFKPVFGFDTYWGEIRDTQGNKNQVDLATIKRQIDECEEMHVDKIICTVHIAWNETTNSLVIAENTDSLLSAISYCADKNVTIDTVKVHMQLKGTSTSEKDYVNNTIGMSTFKTKYKAMLTTICNLFKNTTVTRITILNEMWYITNSSLGHSTFINECLNLVKSAGYTTGLTMAGFTSNQKLADAVIQNIDTFYINVYPGISGSGSYITKQEAIEAFNQSDVDLWIAKLKKDYPNKKVIISEMGTNDYWECLAAPSSWNVTGATKTGGYAVDTYITAMMEFFIRNNVEIEELWWWYDLYYEPVKETLLNYLGGDR